MSAVLVTTGHLPGPQMVRCGSVRSVVTPTSFESLGLIQMRFKRFQLRRWAQTMNRIPTRRNEGSEPRRARGYALWVRRTI